MDFSALKNLIPGYSTYNFFSSFANKWNNTKDVFSRFGNWLGEKWDDWTGKSAVDMQNKAQLDLAKYQTQVQEQMYNKYSSPEALMRQYKEAGLNPNLIYGSAGSGQGNVPSFTAPHVERNMSGSDKINKALSLISALQGVKMGEYNTEAAREAAEQSSIRTLRDLVSYRSEARDYDLFNQASGYLENTLFKRMFKKRRGAISQAEIEALVPDGFSINSKLDSYLGAYRSKMLADFARPGAQNRRDVASAIGEEISNKYLDSYLDTRNKQASLNFDIDNDFKKFTTVSNAANPILQFLTNTLRYVLKKRF